METIVPGLLPFIVVFVYFGLLGRKVSTGKMIVGTLVVLFCCLHFML